MTATDDADELPPKVSAAEREARAEQALKNIFSGGDLAGETLALSNQFTDEVSGRLKARLRRLARRPKN